MATRTLQLLGGALLAAAIATPAAAQDDEPDYSRLIFEVAEIPPVVETDAGANAAAAASNATAAAPAAEAQIGTANAASTDADNPRNLTVDINAYRARISDTLANSNPYSAALREQYDSLGTLLQQAGDHEEAITAFESAMHIDRVNGGLYTLDQIPVVEKMIASHDALGNVDDVNDLHGYLFYIQQRTYKEGDPRLLVAMEDWADWNMTSFLREGPSYDSLPSFNTGASLSTGRMDYVAVQNRDGSFSYIPRSQMLGAMGPMRMSILDPAFTSTYGVNPEQVIDERLRTAREYYERIVEVQTPEEDAAPAGPAAVGDENTPLADEIRVQHKLANVAFAVKQQIDGIEMVAAEGSLYYNRALQPGMDALPVTRGYISNREALTALAEQLEQDPAIPAREKAQAWIDVGDWHVGFDNASRGDDAYRKAWEILNAAGMPATEIADVFMPEPLVVAPGFAIHPFSREIHDIPADAELAWKGYMDLTLNVNRYGDVNGAKVEVESEGTPQVLRTELLRYLRGAKVRPAIIDGEMAKREGVKLRYYYTY